MPSQNLLVPASRATLAVFLFLVAWSAWIGTNASAGPAPAPSPSSAPAPPAAGVTGATQAIDTYRINAGKSQGYAAGDRVRIVRAGRIVAEATVLQVSATSAEIVVRSSPSPRLQAGDVVEFVRRRPPLVDARPVRNPQGSKPGGATGTSPSGGLSPTDWRELGKVPGLLGEDWMTRTTRTCQVWARKADCTYVDKIAAGLDESYDVNRSFMGIDIETPVKFYFFSMAEPAHKQPMFARRLANHTRFAGIAMGDINTCVINEGNPRTSNLYEPWTLDEVCRHEMNHIFAYRGIIADRLRTKGWFLEALAHTIEDTIRPPSTRLDQASLRAFMSNYKAADASFAALIQDRNNDNLEQYRDYDKILVSVVFYLQAKYGNDVIARVVRATSQGQDLEDAFTQVCGKGVKSLEVEWREHYGVR